LVKFNPELAEREQIVVGNKIDLATDEQLETLNEYFTSRGYQYFTMCAPIVEGTKEIIDAVAAKLATLPPIKRYESEEIPAEIFENGAKNGFSIDVEDDVYFVEAEWLLKILQRTDLDDYESLQYFQRVLRSSGIIDALVEKGIQPGDTVSIYDLEFDYVP
ncbi:MAG: Obg family GTPase CgtA, partial [Acutalibacteraceae bacterium]